MADIVTTVLDQLMQQVRNEDELIHSWTRTLVTVQGGLLAGAGVLWNATGVGVHSKGLGSLLLTILAIAVARACAATIRSECRWQGQYISYVQSIPGNEWLYKAVKIPLDDQGMAKSGGVIASNVTLVECAIYVIWALLMLGVLVKVAQMSPFI
jgi:hypothetical protein